MYSKLIILSLFVTLTIATTCTNPQIKQTFFSTEDATIVSQIAYITEFTLKCSNSAQIQLFAEVGGKLTPVVRVGDDKYQVSWNEEIKKSKSGTHTIRLFDEESFAAVRKAQRSGEDIQSVKGFSTLNVSHPGAYNGPWINSELLATGLVLFVGYIAFSQRSKILS
uniref:Translocon-associated protein subunit delta n=1 Tax=Corethrella appendiculata TaxID=1370023 RepID=U5ESD6_9DIPT